MARGCCNRQCSPRLGASRLSSLGHKLVSRAVSTGALSTMPRVRTAPQRPQHGSPSGLASVPGPEQGLGAHLHRAVLQPLAVLLFGSLSFLNLGLVCRSAPGGVRSQGGFQLRLLLLSPASLQLTPQLTAPWGVTCL